MISIQGKVEIASARDRAFEIFSRVDQWPNWWLDCRRVELVPDWQVGAGLDLTLVPHKMRLRLRTRVVGYEKPEAAIFDWNRLGVRGRFTWLFSEQEGGCLVEERLDLKGAGLFVLRGLGQVEALGLMVQRNLDSLKAYVEKGPA